MDTTSTNQANNDQASRPSSKRKGVPVPPGMTLEACLARNKQNREDKKLADQTAENTEFNKNIIIVSDQTAGNREFDKNIITISDQTPKNTGFNKSIKWADLSHPIQP